MTETVKTKRSSTAKPGAKKPAVTASSTAATAAEKKPAAKKTSAKLAPAKSASSAKKPAAAKKPAVKRPAKLAVAVPVEIVTETFVISDEQRYRMVAEAAYFHAESHNFQSDPVRDWIEAEKDIAALLGDKRR